MQQGAREAAPDQLSLVQAFLNTRDAASDRDELATPAAMAEWLATQRLIARHSEFHEDDRRRLVAVRDALQALVAAAGDGDRVGQRRALTTINETSRRIKLGLRLHPDEGYRLVASGVGVERPIGDLLVAVMRAMAEGEWGRLKVCANTACRRAFQDASRNRSARWCSMGTCGNRIKGRAYRRRQASLRMRVGPLDRVTAAAG